MCPLALLALYCQHSQCRGCSYPYSRPRQTEHAVNALSLRVAEWLTTSCLSRSMPTAILSQPTACRCLRQQGTPPTQQLCGAENSIPSSSNSGATGIWGGDASRPDRRQRRSDCAARAACRPSHAGPITSSKCCVSIRPAHISVSGASRDAVVPPPSTPSITSDSHCSTAILWLAHVMWSPWTPLHEPMNQCVCATACACPSPRECLSSPLGSQELTATHLQN